MIALEIAGLVEVRVGAGTFVTDKGAPRRGERPAVRGRRVLAAGVDRAAHDSSPEVAALAPACDKVRNRRHRRTIDMIAARRTHPRIARADHQFHIRIGVASHNGILTAVVDECWAEMYSPMFERMGASPG